MQFSSVDTELTEQNVAFCLLTRKNCCSFPYYYYFLNGNWTRYLEHEKDEEICSFHLEQTNQCTPPPVRRCCRLSFVQKRAKREFILHGNRMKWINSQWYLNRVVIKCFILNCRDPPILQAHNNTDIILRLPMGKRIRDIRWLSVWCRRFTVSHLGTRVQWIHVFRQHFCCDRIGKVQKENNFAPKPIDQHALMLHSHDSSGMMANSIHVHSRLGVWGPLSDSIALMCYKSIKEIDGFAFHFKINLTLSRTTAAKQKAAWRIYSFWLHFLDCAYVMRIRFNR